jgi:chromodomain-helicase-DNA-binding protein 1
VLDSRNTEEGAEKEYLIKWMTKAHIHATWHTRDGMKGKHGLRKLDNFMSREGETKAFYDDLETTKEERELIDIEREVGRGLIEDYIVVERVIGTRLFLMALDFRKIEAEEDDPMAIQEEQKEYLCKWKNLPYCDATWEVQEDISEYQGEIDAMLDRNNSERVPHKSTGGNRNKQEFKKFAVQPNWITGGTLRDYQLLGNIFRSF